MSPKGIDFFVEDVVACHYSVFAECSFNFLDVVGDMMLGVDHFQ
jgi:hypothetical protein